MSTNSTLIIDILEGLSTEIDYTCSDSYASLSGGPWERTQVDSAITRFSVRTSSPPRGQPGLPKCFSPLSEKWTWFGRCAGNAPFTLEIHSLSLYFALCPGILTSEECIKSLSCSLISGYIQQMTENGKRSEWQKSIKTWYLFTYLLLLVGVAVSASQPSTKGHNSCQGTSLQHTALSLSGSQ